MHRAVTGMLATMAAISPIRGLLTRELMRACMSAAACWTDGLHAVSAELEERSTMLAALHVGACCDRR